MRSSLTETDNLSYKKKLDNFFLYLGPDSDIAKILKQKTNKKKHGVNSLTLNYPRWFHPYSFNAFLVLAQL